jgi:8-oxo-dGTP diphosphatase
MHETERPEGLLFSASCHNLCELKKAMQLKADFVVLSPVLKTQSHLNAKTLGWKKFENLVEQATIPVFALGGLAEAQIELAYKNGAQGVAGIRAWW